MQDRITEHDVLASIRLEILLAQRSVLGPSWFSPGTCDAYARLYFIESGRGYVDHHGSCFRMTPGRIYLVPANTQVSYGCESAVVIHWCHFNAWVLGGLDLFDYLKCGYEAIPARPGSIAAQFRRLWCSLNSGWPGEVLETDGILRQLLAPFMQTVDRTAQGRREKLLGRFAPVTDHVASNYAGAITVPELAALVNLEPTYFTKLFSSCFGMPPVRYLQQKRIEAAQRMLVGTNLTIKQIAENTGFGDVFHFSKAFSKHAGMPPAAYRKVKSSPTP